MSILYCRKLFGGYIQVAGYVSSGWSVALFWNSKKILTYAHMHWNAVRGFVWWLGDMWDCVCALVCDRVCALVCDRVWILWYYGVCMYLSEELVKLYICLTSCVFTYFLWSCCLALVWFDLVVACTFTATTSRQRCDRLTWYLLYFSLPPSFFFLSLPLPPSSFCIFLSSPSSSPLFLGGDIMWPHGKQWAGLRGGMPQLLFMCPRTGGPFSQQFSSRGE